MKKNTSNIIFKLQVLAKEKEAIRRKLVVTAQQIAKTAKEKESVRRKLAVIAKEKEHIREKLAVTIQKLKLKAKQLTVNTLRKKAILASIGDAVMACDKEGLVILFNRKAVEITGFSAKEVIGKHYNHVVKFVKEVDGQPVEDFIAKALKTGHKTTMADNTLLIRKNGSKIPVTDSAEPIRYTKKVLIGCVVIFRDITQEKETDKAKSEFISVASHQLKTPATIVSLYTEILLSGVGGGGGAITQKQKEYLDEIYNANMRIVDIINTLLNISRIEMGIFSMVSVPIDIIAFLKNGIKELQIDLQEKKITLQQDYHKPQHIVPIDKLLLNMVFSNLLSNSIKYTASGGTISVKSQEVKKNDNINNRVIKENSLLVSVSDNGIGIPASSQDKIFNKFFRSENARTEHTDGTGLGLYIVKSILDHIGGDVWFLSKEKEGSNFYFTIPLDKARRKKLR